MKISWIFNFCLFFLAKVTFTDCRFLSLIGSRLLPSVDPFKAFLYAYNLDENSFVNVSLKAGDEFEKTITFDSLDGRLVFEEINFELPDSPQESYNLIITHLNTSDDSCRQQTIELLDISQRPIVIIQRNKPIYKTGDEVKFRIFTLTQKLLPFEFSSMDVSILDSSERLVEKFTEINSTEFGVYESSFKIADSPNLGSWKILAEVNGYKKSQTFQVQSPDDFQVDLQVDKVVAFVEKQFDIFIVVKNPPEKSFSGTASIKAHGHFIRNGRYAFSMTEKSMNVTHGKNLLLINFNDDFDIQYLRKDVMIKFQVEVVEDITKKSSRVDVDVKVQHKGTRDIFITRESHFRPGAKFPIDINVRHLDGRPLNRPTSLIVYIDYQNFDPRTRVTKSDRKKFEVKLRSGQVSLTLSPATATRKIIITVDHAGMEVSEAVEPFEDHESREFLQVTIVEASYNVGDFITISVESSEEMEVLHVMVIASNGIAFNADFPDAASKTDFNFLLELMIEMSPEANIIVYYVKDITGEIIYDTVTVKLEVKMENSITIAATETTKPAEKVNILVKTSDSSLVFLKAIDADLQFQDDEVTKESLSEELAAFNNLTFDDPSSYEFGKFNAFVMQPLVNFQGCDQEAQNSSENFKNLDIQPSTQAEAIISKFFPDSWLFDSFEVDSETSINLAVPDSLNSWKIHGISMHPTRGFAVVPKDVKIQTIKELAIRIYAPQSVHQNEVLQVQYGIFNYLKHQINTFIFIEITNSDFMDEQIEENCRKYTTKVIESFTDSFDIPAGSMSKIKEFLIRPNGSGHVSVKITATGDGQAAIVEKTVEVRNLGENGHDKNFSKDLLGPALEGFEKVFPVNYNLNDFTVSKFTASIIAYKYLNETSSELTEEVLKRVKVDYQEVLQVLNLSLSQNGHSDLRMVSDIAKSLIDARELTTVDESAISDALNFLKNHQQPDGSFSFNKSSDLRRDIGAEDFQAYILTAQVISSFLSAEAFQDEISSSINFLKNPEMPYKNDYEKAVVAYSLALASENEESKALIESIAGNYRISTKRQKHYSIFIEIASYLILTKILNGDDPQEDVDWLLTKRHKNGEFYSPYDTALAMRALYEFRKSKEGNLELEIENSGQAEYETFSGFKIDVNVEEAEENFIKINFNTSLKPMDIRFTNLIVIEVSLPSGFEYAGHENDENVLDVQLISDKNFIIFYISQMERGKKYSQSVTAERIYEVEELEDAEIKIYDYYRPNMREFITYGYNRNGDGCNSKTKGDETESKGSWWLDWFG